MQNINEHSRIRSYDFINTRISNTKEEIDGLTKKLNEARENGLRAKAREINKSLKIEKELLKTLNKIKKAYIDAKAIYKELIGNEHDYNNGRISKISFLTNKSFLESKLKRISKNLSFEYREEIDEQVKSDFSKVLLNDDKSIDIKRKNKTPLAVIFVVVAGVLLTIVIESINNHPKDIYKDALPKPDDFSVLMQNMEEINEQNDNKVIVPTMNSKKEYESKEKEPKSDMDYYEDSPNEIHVNYIR